MGPGCFLRRGRSVEEGMKLRFLAASLENGRDGVADYTLRMAEECAKRGHACEAIAFNDRYVETLSQANATVRLPRSMPWARRVEQVNALLPMPGKSDWTCVQFTPYALHSKGMVHGWGKKLRELAGPARVQVMLHEIWIGEGGDAPLRRRLVGKLQRAALKSLIKTLRPEKVHTSNENYAGLLRDAGIPATTLPLPGNVPYQPAPAGAAENLVKSAFGVDRSAAWIFGIFGTLYNSWPQEPLLSMICAEGKKAGKEICIASFGRIGEGQVTWDRLVREYAGKIRFAQLGPMEPREISHTMQALDFGIATTPYAILGKSGTVAAMREHGLPIIVSQIHAGDERELPADLISAGTIGRLSAARKSEPRGIEPMVSQFLRELSA